MSSVGHPNHIETAATKTRLGAGTLAQPAVFHWQSLRATVPVTPDFPICTACKFLHEFLLDLADLDLKIPLYQAQKTQAVQQNAQLAQPR
jgi:hypothetical protein